MWPVQLANKKSCYEQSMPRPAKLQSDSAKLQSEYKKKDQVKFNQVSMNDDKKCQSIVCLTRPGKEFKVLICGQ